MCERGSRRQPKEGVETQPGRIPNALPKKRACYALQRYTWYDFSMTRKPYPSDVSDEERAFVAPSLTFFMTEDAPQRDHSLREVLNGLRWIVRTGAPWRMMPNAPPPWYTVSQQTQRWLKAGVFATLVHDLRAPPLPPPQGGAGGGAARAGYDGHKRPPCPPACRGGGKVHVAEAVHYLYARKYITGSR